VLGVIVALICLTAVVHAPSPAASSSRLSLATSDPCGSAAAATSYGGALSVSGGPLASSAAAGVSLTYSYWLETSTSYIPANGTTTSCSLATGTSTTGSAGAFTFSIPLPSSNCFPDPPYGEECVNYAGPYGPVAVDPTDAPPAGYGLSTSQNGTDFDLTWVAGLASVELTPRAGPIVVSTGAPTPFVATPQMANGTTSSLDPSYSWSVRGDGWSFAGAPSVGASVSVVAAAGASGGSLAVAANETLGGNAFVTPQVDIPLVATPTAIGSVALDATTVDAGEPLALTADVTGAPGYLYRAIVTPGFGANVSDAPCIAWGGNTTSVVLRCTATVTYPDAGTAQLTVQATNGYSSVNWTSPPITIVPAAVLDLNPAAPVGYAGVPIPLTVSVAPGTGVAPYRSACLVAGGAVSDCASGVGPSWPLAPNFPVAGNYSAVASVVDANGVNATVPVEVRVVDPLAVGPVAPSLSNLTVGNATPLSADLAGGDLPVEVWWNVSGQPIATYSVASDGPLRATYTGTVLGPIEVTVTVRDALGTRAFSNRTLAVVLGPAASIARMGPPLASSVVAGTSVPLSWEALDTAGDAVTDFAQGGSLTITTSTGAPALSWANASGGASLSSGPESSFVVPASAWNGARFSLNWTPLTAGELTVRLSGPGILADVPAISLLVLPEAMHLRLFDPDVVIAGDRTNRTFWHVADRYGNAVPGAYLVIETTTPTTVVDQSVIVGALASGGSGAWVNFTLPTSAASVRVLDTAGQVLLGPFSWGTVPSSTLRPLAPIVLGASAATGLVGAVLAAVPRRPGRRGPLPDDESAARELAEGRAAIVEIVRSMGFTPRETFEELWSPPPVPPDLYDWIASLVADGTLVELRGASGALGYALAPESSGFERVVVDPAAIDRALEWRDASVREPEEPAP